MFLFVVFVFVVLVCCGCWWFFWASYLLLLLRVYPKCSIRGFGCVVVVVVVVCVVNKGRGRHFCGVKGEHGHVHRGERVKRGVGGGGASCVC